MAAEPRPTLNLNGEWTQQRQPDKRGSLRSWLRLLPNPHHGQRSLGNLGPWVRAKPDSRRLHRAYCITSTGQNCICSLLMNICCDKLMNVFRRIPSQIASGTIKFPFHCKFFSPTSSIPATLQANMNDPFGVGASSKIRVLDK